MSEAVAVGVHNVYHLPEGHDFAAGASLLMTYGTSIHALVDRGHIAEGDTLLVLGASGGVGIAAVELGVTRVFPGQPELSAAASGMTPGLFPPVTTDGNMVRVLR